MASLRFVGLTGSRFDDPGSPDNFMVLTMNVDVTVNGAEHRVAVQMKQVVGSDPSEQAIEVYPAKWPDGVLVRDDEIRNSQGHTLLN